MGQFQSFIGVDFWTALFVLMNTLAVFFVAKKYLFGPVHKMITDRQKEIDDMYADAGKARDEAREMATEYQKRLADAQATSDRLMKEAVIRAQHREDEIVRRANAEASAILSKAAADVEQEKKKAVNNAKDEIAEIAMAVAAKVVDRQLNGADQSALVDKFIRELGDKE